MPKSTYTLGRESSADVPVADTTVSRLHAHLTPVAGGRLQIADCRSSNGTYSLRGGRMKQIEQEIFEASEQVQFGAVVVSVGDLLEIIGKASEPVRAAPLARSARLVRCACGAVKRPSNACEFCGV